LPWVDGVVVVIGIVGRLAVFPSFLVDFLVFCSEFLVVSLPVEVEEDVGGGLLGGFSGGWLEVGIVMVDDGCTCAGWSPWYGWLRRVSYVGVFLLG